MAVNTNSRLLRAVLFLTVPVVSTGCTLLPFGGWPTGDSTGETALGGTVNVYRAVFHCHSHLSHDSDGSIEEIAAAARSLKIHVVFLTDHYSPGNIAKSPRGLIDGVLFIPGVEFHWGDPHGSLLAIGVREDFEPNQPRDRIVLEMQRQGALLVAGHVEEMDQNHDFSPYDGFELYNFHAQFKSASKFALALRFLFYPPDPFFQAMIEEPREHVDRWARLALSGRKLAPLVGHDAHANVRVFGPLGGTIGTYPELFRLFSTRILATELTEEAILAGLRGGRSYVVFDAVWPNSFRFEYWRREADADIVASIGDTARYAEGSRMQVAMADDGEIQVFRDGTEIHRQKAREFEFEPPGPGAYRVEVWNRGKLWVVSAPIYLTASPTDQPLPRS